MSLNNLSATNISGALIDAGDFVINKRLVSNNQILYYTDPVTSIKTGYVWKGTLPHITSTNNPSTDGGISDTAWVPVIYSKLKEKMESEGLTLGWNAHLPTVEVAYGLTKNSLKMWESGSTATSVDYWLYTDGTVWNGTGVLGTTPETSTGFEKITPNFNASIKTYSASATDGQTDFNIPFTFSTITVFVNGSIQLPGLNYTVSGSTLTFTTELETGDMLYVFIGKPNISTNDRLNRIYTANAIQGQTTIQVPYDFSTAIVYINGVLQNPSTAYSIGADRIITFSEELYQDDEIIVMLGDVVVQSDDYVLKNDLSGSSAASEIGIYPSGTIQDAITFITPEMFGSKSDGIYDDAVAIQLAVNYAESINSNISTRAPRIGIQFSAKTYYLKETITVRKGTVTWKGAGMYQTLFVPHPDANSDDYKYKYFFNFCNENWVSNTTRTLHEVNLSNFTFRGDSLPTTRPVFYLGGVGWDCVIDTVQVYSAGLSAFVCDDLFDTQFYNLRINSCGSLHDPSNSNDIFTHAIMLRGKYDSCNAVRFIAPHFENNFTGVISITGTSNNISFTSMPKFENNSRGTSSGVAYSVISLNGSLIESIKFDNPFISHPVTINNWFLESNSRHLSIHGGSFMSPSDLSGKTAKKWIRIHRDNWVSATRCVGAIIDIDMMHVNGIGDNGVAPISIENDAIISIQSPRIVDPNRFFDILYNCKIDINYLTVLGTITSTYQTALFNITGADVKADININQQLGSVSNLIYINSSMTAATRRKSKISVQYNSTQNAVGTLTNSFDPNGINEGYIFQASGLVSTIGVCHVGKIMIIRCPDTSNCLVSGGNVYLTNGTITAPCTVTLMSTNFSFRQGWTEISRTNGI